MEIKDKTRRKKVYINDFRTGKTKVVEKTCSTLTRSLNSYFENQSPNRTTSKERREPYLTEADASKSNQKIIYNTDSCQCSEERRKSDPFIGKNTTRNEESPYVFNDMKSFASDGISTQHSIDVECTTNEVNKYNSEIIDSTVIEEIVHVASTSDSYNHRCKTTSPFKNANSQDSDHLYGYDLKEMTEITEVKTEQSKHDLSEGEGYMIEMTHKVLCIQKETSPSTTSEDRKWTDSSGQDTSCDESIESGMIQSSNITVSSLKQKYEGETCSCGNTKNDTYDNAIGNVCGDTETENRSVDFHDANVIEQNGDDIHFKYENENEAISTRTTKDNQSMDSFHSSTEIGDFTITEGSLYSAGSTHVETNKEKSYCSVGSTNIHMETEEQHQENSVDTERELGNFYSKNDDKSTGICRHKVPSTHVEEIRLGKNDSTDVYTSIEISSSKIFATQIDTDLNINSTHDDTNTTDYTVVSENVDIEKNACPDMQCQNDGIMSKKSVDEFGDVDTNDTRKESSTQTDFVYSSFQKMYSILCEKCGHTTDMHEILLNLLDYPLMLENGRFCTNLEEKIITGEKDDIDNSVNDYAITAEQPYQYQFEPNEIEQFASSECLDPGITTYGSFAQSDTAINYNWKGSYEPFDHSQNTVRSISMYENSQGEILQLTDIETQPSFQFTSPVNDVETTKVADIIQGQEHHQQFPSNSGRSSGYWNLTNEYQDQMVENDLEHAVRDFNLTYESLPYDNHASDISSQGGSTYPGGQGISSYHGSQGESTYLGNQGGYTYPGGLRRGENVASLVTEKLEGSPNCVKTEEINEHSTEHTHQNKVLQPSHYNHHGENNSSTSPVTEGTLSTSQSYYNPLFIQNHSCAKKRFIRKASCSRIKSSGNKRCYRHRGDLLDTLSVFAEENYLDVQNVSADGNCMFSAVVDQLWINGNFRFTPDSLRKGAIQFLKKYPTHRDGTHLESFLTTETWENYLIRMSRDGEWGDHMILQGVSEVTKCRIIVINSDIVKTELSPWHAECEMRLTDTVLLGHMGEYHYVSLRPMNWQDTWGIKAKIKFFHEIHAGHESDSVGRKNQGDRQINSINEGLNLHNQQEHQERTKESPRVSDEQTVRSDSADTGNVSPQFQTREDKTGDSTIEKNVRDTNISKEKTHENEIDETQETIPDRTGVEDFVANKKEIDLSNFAFENNEMIENNQDPKTTIELLGSSDDLLTMATETRYTDPLSALSMCHLSFCLSILIEPGIIHIQNVCPGYHYSLKKSAREHNVDIIVYGKVREELAVTISCWQHQHTVRRPQIVCYKADIVDIVYDIDSVKASHSLIVNTESCQPGFLRLQIVNPKYFEKWNFSEIGGNFFLEDVSLNYTVKNHNQWTQPKIKVGFQCPKWPNELTSEFFSRKRPSGFPESKVIEEFSNRPCYIRKYWHPNSQYPNAEWQFIFPEVEIEIVTNKLHPDILYVLRLFKLLIDFHTTSALRQLRTNHIKTVVLFAWEKLPLSVWSDNIGGVILYLTSTLIQSLHNRHLSHYIMISVNLFDCYSNQEIDSLIRCIENIRLFPLMAVNVFAEHNDLLNQWIIQPIANDMHRFREDKDYLLSLEQTFCPMLLELAKRLVMNQNFCKGYSMVERAFETTHKLEEGRKVDNPQTFKQFVEPFVYSVDDPIVRYFFTNFVDIRLQTDILSKMRDSDQVRKVGDVVEREENGDFNEFPIPDGNKLDDVEYLDSFCQYLMTVEKYESAAHYLRCAIALGKQDIRSEIIDIGEGMDEEIKTQLGNKNAKTEHNYSVALYNLYNHLIESYKQMKQPMLFQEYIHDYEDLVETYMPYYYRHLSKIWYDLGNEEKSKFFETKYTEYQQNMQSTRV